MIRRTKKTTAPKKQKKEMLKNGEGRGKSIKLAVSIAKRKIPRKNALVLEKNIGEVDKMDENFGQGNFQEEDAADDKKKTFIMWGGVCFFMLVIFVFWVNNAKQVFQSSHVKNPDAEKSFSELKSITGEIGRQMNGIKETIADLKNATSTASSTIASDLEVPMLPEAESAVRTLNESASSTATIATTTILQ